MYKVSKWKFKAGYSQVIFRTPSRNIVSINQDNITDELVKIAQDNDRGHLFEEIKDVKKKVDQLNTQSLHSLSTLNEVEIDEKDSLPVQPNKRGVLVTKKKVGRPPKSK